MEAPYKKPKKIKLFLLATMFIVLGGIIVVYIVAQQNSQSPEPIQESGEPDATLSIGKIRQTATREGKKEWTLEAGSAYYINKFDQMVLKDLLVTFYLKDNSEVTLTADRGVLNTESNDIEVSGNVVVKNNQYRMLTESLSYIHDKRVLYSKSPVTIAGTSARLAANRLSMDLNSKKLTLEGSVETTLDDHFTQ